jgi:glycosyltransferase involved in cell wall biosynthesis
MNDKLVSIVMPTYNRGNVIHKAINSVINQSYSNWELIIIDDGSTDNTKEVVRYYLEKDLRIKFVSNSLNKGANACRNQGATLANGKYLAFIDSDNQWYKDKLIKQLEIIEDSSLNIDFVYSKEEVIDEKFVTIVPRRAYSMEELRKVLPLKNVVDTSTVLMKKAIFFSVGGFDENMPRFQDWELFFRIVVVYGYNGICVNEVLNKNILQSDSISKSNKKLVDGILSMIKKHKAYLNDINLISFLFSSANNEVSYTIQKIKELYEDDPSVMERIMEKLIFMKQNVQKQYDFLYQWQLKDKNLMYKNIENKKIAIYGLGRFGELLYRDLRKRPVKIMYGIDKKVDGFHNLTVKTPDKSFTDVDAIVIAVINGATEIKNMLSTKFNGEVILIEDLIKQKE